MADQELHDCSGDLPHGDSHGAAVTYCLENEVGELWVSNEEYASQVNYCPYCGFKARVQLTETVTPVEAQPWHVYDVDYSQRTWTSDDG